MKKAILTDSGEKIIKTVCLAACLLLFALLIYSVTLNTSSVKTSENFWEENWILEIDGKQQSVRLPMNLPNAPQEVTLTKELPPWYDNAPRTLSIYTNYLPVTISMDGVLIASPTPMPFGLSSAPAWKTVQLPAPGALGVYRELTLKLKRSGSKSSIDVYKVLLGSSNDVKLALLNSGVPVLLATVLLVLLAIFFFILRFLLPTLYKKNKTLALPWFSLFLMLSALWLLTDSTLPTAWNMDEKGIFLLNLFSFQFMPLPCILFVAGACVEKKKMLIQVSAIFLILAVANSSLALFGVIPLRTTMVFSHALMGMVLFAILAACFIEYFYHKNNDVSEIFFGMAILGCFGALELLTFYSNKSMVNSCFYEYGLFACALTLTAGTIRRGLELHRDSLNLKELISSIPSGICRLDTNGTIHYANEYYYQIFGYTEAEAQEQKLNNLQRMVYGEDWQLLRRELKSIAEARQGYFELELRHAHKYGMVHWVLVRVARSAGADGGLIAVLFDITDRKRVEEKLQISEEEYRIAAQHSEKLIVRYDIHARKASPPQNMPENLAPFALLAANPVDTIAHKMVPDESKAALRCFFDDIHSGTTSGSATFSLYAGTTLHWYQANFTNIYTPQGLPVQAIISCADVTQQREKELAFEKWRQSYESLPRQSIRYYEYNLSSDVLEHKEGELLPAMPDTARTLTEIITYAADNYLPQEDKERLRNFYSRERLLNSYEHGVRSDTLDCQRITAEGKRLWTRVSVQMVSDPFSSGIKAFILVQDVDEEVRAEKELEERSRQDSLTGLLNRRALEEEIQLLLSTSTERQIHAFIVMDVDHFKEVNDTLGHQIGDDVLITVANKLSSTLRSDDLCGRLGGDEFAVCLRNVRLGTALDQRLTTLCELVRDDRHGVSTTGSLGVSIYPADGMTFDELYKRADIALYAAKEQGRARVVRFDPKMER